LHKNATSCRPILIAAAERSSGNAGAWTASSLARRSRADIPERHGPSTTRYNRFIRRAKIGVRDRMFEAVSKAYDSELPMIDSSSIRVRQRDANGEKGP
jgi:hypothetical protein